MIVIKDNIQLNSKKDVVLTHLYLKSKQFGIDLSEGVKQLIFCLYEFGDISSKEEFEKFTKICNHTTPLKSRDSVRNELSVLCSKQIVFNNGKYNKTLSKDWLPELNDKQIGLEYKIINKVEI